MLDTNDIMTMTSTLGKMTKRQRQQDKLAKSLKWLINDCPEAVNGVIIWVDHPLLKGKLVFEIDGKLPLEEAYAERMRRERATA